MSKRIKLIAALFALIFVMLGGYFVYKSPAWKPVGQDTRIVVVVKTVNPEEMEFWQVVESGAKVAAAEFGVQARVTGPMSESDVSGQIQLLEEIIKEKPHAIVLAAADYNALVPSAQKIKKAGIKLITIDSGLNSDLPESFIATDNVEAGKKAGRELAEMLEEGSEVAIVSYVKGSLTAIEREQGVREGLSNFPHVKVIGTYYSESDRNKSFNITKEILSKNKGIKGIAALNEPTTIGVARALKELGLDGSVKLVGFDSSIDEIKLIEEGAIQATVVQNPFNMGYRGIEMAVKALKGEKISKRIDTGSVVVTKENMYTKANQQLLFPFVNADSAD